MDKNTILLQYLVECVQKQVSVLWSNRQTCQRSVILAILKIPCHGPKYVIIAILGCIQETAVEAEKTSPASSLYFFGESDLQDHLSLWQISLSTEDYPDPALCASSSVMFVLKEIVKDIYIVTLHACVSEGLRM